MTRTNKLIATGKRATLRLAAATVGWLAATSCGTTPTAVESISEFERSPLFVDEFDGTALDRSKWTIDKEKYRTDEVQCYTLDPQNVKVANGNLQLIAVRVVTPYACAHRNQTDFREYTSGSIRTVDALSALGYGRYEARIKLPVGHGFFSAFWTLGFGGGWPGNGEVDIMEHVGQAFGARSDQRIEDVVRGTSHWIDAAGRHTSDPRGTSPALNLAEYHVFAVERTPRLITWFVDGVEYASLNIEGSRNGTDELHTNHAILLNFALGGWPPSPDASTPFPSVMSVDWVRYYRYKANR